MLPQTRFAPQSQVDPRQSLKAKMLRQVGYGSVPDACHCFLFADETVSNTIPCEAHMARGIAITTVICRQPGDAAGFRAHAVIHANAVDMDLLACGGELQASFEA